MTMQRACRTVRGTALILCNIDPIEGFPDINRHRGLELSENRRGFPQRFLYTDLLKITFDICSFSLSELPTERVLFQSGKGIRELQPQRNCQ
jgi:hypothetical protein